MTADLVKETPMSHLQLVTKEVCLSFENLLQDLNDTNDLLLISELGRGHILSVEDVEPNSLTIVRSLTRHLEVQVLLQVPLVRRGGGIQLVLLVVRLDKVLEDGAGLPDSEVIGIGINEGRETAVGVDLEEGFVLGVGDEFALVGDVELLKNEEDLQWVGTTRCDVLVQKDIGGPWKFRTVGVNGEGLDGRHGRSRTVENWMTLG